MPVISYNINSQFDNNCRDVRLWSYKMINDMFFSMSYRVEFRLV